MAFTTLFRNRHKRHAYVMLTIFSHIVPCTQDTRRRLSVPWTDASTQSAAIGHTRRSRSNELSAATVHCSRLRHSVYAVGQVMCRCSAGVAARTSSLQLRTAESHWRGESSSPVQRRSEQQLQHGHLNINACRDDMSPAHTHTHPFNGPFFRDYPCEPVPQR